MLADMPIYEYHCLGCDERFEELVRGPDAAVACPGCQGAEVQRLLSTFAGVGGTKGSAPDYSRLMADVGRSGSGGCCGGACGHAH
jgi:putative FmdB family regulatory protein